MDMEEEIRALQLDSSEDNDAIASSEVLRPEEVGKPDKMEEDWRDEDHEVNVNSQPGQVEPKGAVEVKCQDVSAPEDIQDEKEEEKKRHFNAVFIGHVDAGKSTTGGQILFLSGKVDDRTIQKYEKEAKDKNRESWYMAYIMDTNEEERVKGKTVEVGRAHFETETTRFTILDAPVTWHLP
ncbi:hypothetical protein RHSIM_Rhsim05G0101100 [Rhododendron simsii]|uniref:Tr-type G domain-containing protein n=1 Tax=Rhododendron simsii TaxID=118357 RepID=A0A834GYQ6_RHOSS|nr:hypothetical protein RHSIM_Rhsim05G0101100 [Rhododendron simsii]